MRAGFEKIMSWAVTPPDFYGLSDLKKWDEFVEFDVPTQNFSPSSGNWVHINGGNSPFGRCNNLPPGMPFFF
jgi:hypothetical protein